MRLLINQSLRNPTLGAQLSLSSSQIHQAFLRLKSTEAAKRHIQDADTSDTCAACAFVRAELLGSWDSWVILDSNDWEKNETGSSGRRPQPREFP